MGYTIGHKRHSVFCWYYSTISVFSGAISSGFRLEESPFVPYDFVNSSTSPASPPGSIGDGWPRAKSPNGSSSVNWPPGKMRPPSDEPLFSLNFVTSRFTSVTAPFRVIGLMKRIAKMVKEKLP